MQDKIVEILLYVLVSVVALFILVAVLDWALPEAAPLGDWADTALAVVTILAILVGGLFAAAKLEIFRDFEPHLRFTHTINHRRLGESYIHIDVVVSMLNSSKVKVDLHEGFWTLQQISPITDNEVEQFFSRDPVEELTVYPWPVLNEGGWQWSQVGLVIEPGETHQELLEFIVPDDTATLLIYTSCYLPADSREESVWDLATVFDIMV